MNTVGTDSFVSRRIATVTLPCVGYLF